MSRLSVQTALIGLALLAAPAHATFPGPNGRIAFENYFSGEIFAANPDGGGLVQLTHVAPDSFAGQPDWSPDGTRIAFPQAKVPTGGPDIPRIWIMRADGSNPHRLAGAPKGIREYQPNFTPDGRHIVYVRCKAGEPRCALWRMRSDGTDKEAITAYTRPGEPNVDYMPSISPDGESVAFTRFFRRGVWSRMWMMEIDGSNLRSLTPRRLEAWGPDWSPGGDQITFTNNSNQFGGGDIFTMNPDGTEIQRITPVDYPPNDQEPTYSPEGDRILFGSDRNYPDACCLDLFTIDPDGGAASMIDLGLPDAGLTQPDWGTAPLLP